MAVWIGFFTAPVILIIWIVLRIGYILKPYSKALLYFNKGPTGNVLGIPLRVTYSLIYGSDYYLK